MKKTSIEIAFITIISLLVVMIFHLINFNGYLGPGDNTTYANLARNIARGDGIAHNTASIPQIIGHVGFPEKDSENPIGWPLVLSLFMIIFGTSSYVPVIASSFFHILNTILVYFLAKQYYSNIIAVCSCCIYSLTYPILHVTTGLSEPFFSTIILTIFLLLKKSENTLTWFFWGILFAGAYYTRFVILFSLAGFILYWTVQFIKNEKIPYKKIIVFLMGLLVIGIPIKLRDITINQSEEVSIPNSFAIYSVFGNEGTQDFLRSIDFKKYNIDLRDKINLEFLISHLSKFFKNLYGYLTDSFSDLGIPLLLALGLFYLFFYNKKESDSILRQLFLCIFFVSIFSLSFIYHYVPRYLVPFIPFIVIFSSKILIDLVRNKIILICIIPILVLKTPAKIINDYLIKEPYENIYRNLKNIVHNHFNQDDIIISNNNTILGWNGNVKAVSFPHKIKDILILDSLYISISGIYLDSEGMKSWGINEKDEWMQIFHSEPVNILTDYKLIENRQHGSFKYLLYKKQIIAG